MDKIELLQNLITVLLHWAGLFGWAYCFLLLMEVVICKDARLLDLEKLFNLPMKVRGRIFLRNLKSPYYLASVIILLSSLIAVCQLSLELWYTTVFNKLFIWTLFHPILTFGIIILYRSFGCRVTYINKIREFFMHERSS